ncbi:tape measure protein [Corynebacterium hansenii]|uniref:Tape measure protein n=1 Tax=Corynebacterium hansenii TaxID=394964 RepID=A0ABV7ZQN8_9CORY|nr:tape measure protein [Corynebacterium hansenii]WJZ00320.1 hypothetical protein CHAN_08555 [Corynebacterium hansenii]
MAGDTVWIGVNAEVRGFMKSVDQAANQAAQAGGKRLEDGFRKGGEQAGKAAADGLKSQAKTIEQVSTKLGTARKAEAEAAARVLAEEKKLDALRSSGKATASQLEAAENRVANAKRRQGDATQQVTRWQRDLTSAQEGGATSSISLANAEDRLAAAKTRAAKASGDVRTAELRESEAKDKASAAAQKAETAEVQLALAKMDHGNGSREVKQAERELEQARKQLITSTNQLATAEGNSIKAKAQLATANDQVRAKSTHLKAVQADVANAEKRTGTEAAAAGRKIRGMGNDMTSTSGPSRGLMTNLGGIAGKAAIAAGAFIGVQGATSFLSSGFDRLMNIQRAEVNFQAIGLTAEQTEAQMARLSEQVTGTSVSLADAAKYSAMFAQAGVELGAPMDDAIQAFTNLSAAAVGTGIDVGRIMQQVAASGKIDAGVLNQLADANVNAAQYLSEFTGKSVAEVRKLASEGKISFEDLVGAINGGMGDYAAAMGETLPAKMANAKTAFATLSAGIIEPFIGPLTTGIEFLTSMLKTVKPAISGFFSGLLGSKTVMIALGVAASGLVGSLIAVKVAAAGVLIAGKVRAMVAAFKAWQLATKGQTVAQIALNMAMKANVIGAIIGVVVALGVALWAFFTKTEKGRELWSRFTDFMGSAWERIKAAFAAGLQAIQPVWDGISSGAQWAWDKLTGFFGWISDAFSGLKSLIVDGDFSGALRDAFGIEEDSPIVGIILGIRDGFISLKDGAGEAIGFLKSMWSEYTDAVSTKYNENIVPILDFFKEKWGQLKAAVEPIIDSIKEKWNVFTTALRETYDAHIAPVVDAFKQKWDELKQRFGAFVTEMWEPLIKPALIALAALLLGPIILAITAVVAIIGIVVGVIMGLVYVIVSLPGWVMGAVNGVKQWFSDLKANVAAWFTEMGASISGWWNEHIAPLPGQVGDAISSVKQFFSDLWRSVMDWFRDMGQSVADFWNNHVAPLPGQVAGAVGDVLARVGEIPGKVKNVFSDAGRWLVNAGRRILNGLWEGMKAAWSSVKSWISSTLNFSAIGSLIGLAGGGVIGYADGGITAYAQGGIAQLESYANGGRRKENHVAQIAPAGAWRVWAEDETGGEAYIPLHPTKRTRSTAILAQTADIFGMGLVDKRTGAPVESTYRGSLGPARGAVQAFADGGVRTASEVRRFVEGENVAGIAMDRSLQGAPYTNSPGPGAWGDCSSTQGRIFDFMIGKNPIGPRAFSTHSQEQYIRSNGGHIGKGPEGSFRMGWNNRGSMAHTSGTLPDGTNVEMGGGNGGGAIGGGAVAWDHPQFDHWGWIPTSSAQEAAATSAIGDLSDMPAVDDATSTTGGSGASGSNPDVGAGPAAVAESAPTTWSELAGSSAKAIVSGQVKDALSVFGVPDEIPPLLQALRSVGIAVEERDNAASQEVVGAEASGTSTTATSTAGDAAGDLAGLSDAAPPAPEPAPAGPDWGMPFFVREISRAAQSKGLDREAAVIGTGTSLVEASDPILMWANRAVPESLNFRHDRIGSDYDSVGIFQQRDNGAWGTVAQRMSPFESALMFFRELVKFDWKSMSRGAAAQKVQRSAFPSRYEPVMGRAEELVAQYGTFGSAPGYASGGYVSGRGGPRDDAIRAWLSNGEYVVNAGAVRDNRALLEAINGGANVAGMVADGVIETGAAAGKAGVSGIAGMAKSAAGTLGPAAAPAAAAIGMAEGWAGMAVDEVAAAAGRVAHAGINTLAEGAANAAGSADQMPVVAARTPNPAPAERAPGELVGAGVANGDARVVNNHYEFNHRDEDAAWRRFKEQQWRDAQGFGPLR